MSAASDFIRDIFKAVIRQSTKERPDDCEGNLTSLDEEGPAQRRRPKGSFSSGAGAAF
jgi:hypothetical protein